MQKRESRGLIAYIREELVTDDTLHMMDSDDNTRVSQK